MREARRLYTRLSGAAASCEGRFVYLTMAEAEIAAAAHNRWQERRHDVEAYECPFCDRFHKGRVAPDSIIRLLSWVIGRRNQKAQPGG